MRLVYSRYRGQLTGNNLCTNMNFFGDFVRTSLLLTFKSDFLKIPRIGVQDGKIEISQTLSQQSPLERVSMGLTDRRKTTKNLVDSRKN